MEIPIHSVNKKNIRKLSAKEEQITFDRNKLITGKIKIGLSNQEFNLLLDTTSGITWVPLERSNDDSKINNHYNPTKSTTSKTENKQNEINNSGYYSKGNYYQDEIQFGNNTKFSLFFGAAKETKFNVENIDGIIGLSYNNENENISFMNSLKKAGIIDSLSFSISIEDNPNKIESNGKIYLGKHEDFSKS